MNLHQFVAGAVGMVNPFVPVSIRASAGSTTGDDGIQTPAYATPIDGVPAQIQPMASRDLRQVEGLNLQGTLKAIYVNGELDGIVRVTLKGGDLVDFPDGSVWLVVQVVEGFNMSAGWTKAVICLQNGA
jgi:hypothetical protein